MSIYVKYITKERYKGYQQPLAVVAQSSVNLYPNLAQMAFNLFAISAMSSECELDFSKASYNISARWSNLSSDIVGRR